MTSFTFPQPGERQNITSVPVPERTLAALYALALVGQGHLTTTDETFVTPQCQDALDHVLMMLSEVAAHNAFANAKTMEQDLRDEYPF